MMARFLVAALLFVSWAAFAKCNENAETVTVIYKKFFPFSERPADYEPVPNDGSCEEVRGVRFMKPGDPSLIRIEDPQGNFVGTQSIVLVDAVKEAIPAAALTETLRWFDNSPQIEKQTIDGQEVYVMSGYTRDPETICDQDASSGPSNTLYFKHGDGYLEVARDNLDLVNDGWVKHPCVAQMGDHYRYKAVQAVDFDCEIWTPVFLLSDGKGITGYGWNYPGKILGEKYESSSEAGFNRVMKPMPTCLTKQFSDNQGYTSQHVYLTPNPQSITCPTQ